MKITKPTQRNVRILKTKSQMTVYKKFPGNA